MIAPSSPRRDTSMSTRARSALGTRRRQGDASLDGRARPSLFAPLDLDEANALLAEGGYGLRVESVRPAGPKLVGPGAGVGLALGTDPTWAEVCRALVRLRRTRRHHDPAWLSR